MFNGHPYFFRIMQALTKRKKVLIIEDEASIRAIIKEYLIDLGVEAHEAEDGALGYLKYKKVPYDLLLVDVTMPKVTGVDLVKNIRANDEETKIVMLTSCADKEVIQELVTVGIQGWILKPFDEAAFRSKLEKILL